MDLNPNRISEADLRRMPDEEFQALYATILEAQREDRKENQLIYYVPASDSAAKVHKSKARTVAIGGGNRSSKTETCLAEISALATGVLPKSIRDDLLPKFRGPLNVRIALESLTTVLHPIMLPKLQWWQWSGIDQPGGSRGHWGWIPKTCLIDGKWERSWSEKLRVLKVLCRDPEDMDKVIGESQIQFMSYDQDWSDYASGSFHIILHDEPPPYMIWKENRSRVLDVNGRLMLAMTWPDDPSIPVDWIFDEIYDRGRGPNKDENIDWFELYTTDNRNLDREAIIAETANWTAETRKVKIEGQPIRFSNRVHPLFTDAPQIWSFPAGKAVYPVDGKCPETGSSEIAEYCHVGNFETSTAWPVIFVLDPHPRKPHMFMWVQVDPSDDLWVIAEGEAEGDCSMVKKIAEEVEESLMLNVQARLIDPNMARSPASQRRGITWQDEFDGAGLRCDLADDSDVGRSRINEFLKPDIHTERPRLHFHSRCQNAIWQMKRYVWDEHKVALQKDLKQKPRPKYDDYPTMLKYCMNMEPQFSRLYAGAPVIARTGTRRGAY